MKRLAILVFLIFVNVSCEPNEEKLAEFYLDLAYVEDVRLPVFLEEGETYEIEIEYRRASSCHFLNAVHYSQEVIKTGNEVVSRNECIVTISVQNIVFKGNCNSEDIQELDQKAILKLKIDQPAGTIYTFQFLKGKDENENYIYLVKKIPVLPKEQIRNYENAHQYY